MPSETPFSLSESRHYEFEGNSTIIRHSDFQTASRPSDRTQTKRKYMFRTMLGGKIHRATV
ncbi:hypothetical protein LN378_32950, partial [Enterobacter hormaechei subsp. steigerwaltii]|nr:hypothetical protein [Enterobacter hormaechei subsp. steigerwaltii]